jgi:hypothetical protein
MVPDAYTAFFAATAGVAGALIGLLFVAISVAAPLADPVDRVEMDVKAGITFSVFVNALAISLFALIPGIGLGITAMVVGAVGVSSCLTFGLILVRETRPERSRAVQLRHLVIQGLVFAYQIVVGVQLDEHPHDVSYVQTLAILTIVLFLVGIVRAWQLIGAREAGLLSELGASIRARHAASPEP